MLRIVSLPSNLEQSNQKHILGFNQFLRKHGGIVNRCMYHFGILTIPEAPEIKNSCLTKLWIAYQSNPNEGVGFYMVTIRHYLLNTLQNMNMQRDRCPIMIEAQFTEKTEDEDVDASEMLSNYGRETITSSIDEKIMLERLEDQLSPAACKFLQHVHLSDANKPVRVAKNNEHAKKQRRFHWRRKLQKLYKYNAKEIASIEAEIRVAFSDINMGIKKPSQLVPDRLLTELVGQEIPNHAAAS